MVTISEMVPDYAHNVILTQLQTLPAAAPPLKGLAAVALDKVPGGIPLGDTDSGVDHPRHRRATFLQPRHASCVSDRL